MKKKQMGILTFFARHNEDFAESVGYGRSKTTYSRYLIVYGHLGAYVRTRYHREDISLRDISPSFITGFDIWLRKERGLSPNSVWCYMIALKHVVKLAQNEGWLTTNPFVSYVNSFSKVDRGYLSEEELLLLMKVEPRTPMEEKVRDVFLFSAFTGLAYIDIRNLRQDNLQQLFDGHWWIITRRQKTGVASYIRLMDVPLRLVEKYGGKTQDGCLFPMMSNNCCNQNLKRLAQRAGIGHNVTIHVGRHTFATLALNRGMPIETLSRILGHTNIRTTQIYARITSKKISEDMAMLAVGLSRVERDICAQLG